MHVVIPVRELYQDYPYVLAHRQDHLPEGFSTRLFRALLLNPADFRDTINELGDFGPEILFYFFFCQVGIFHCIMKKPRHHAGDVEIHLSQHVSDFKGVNKVGFAGEPDRSPMHLCGQDIGTLK